MSMKAEGRVGTIDASSGSLNTLRTARDGSLVVQVGGGRYIEAARAGRLFSVATQAAVATTVTLNTNWEGLRVANPAGSGKNLVMLEFGWSMAVVGSADGAVGLAVKGKKPVCVINFTCSNYWQLKSWDKFVIPKPFSKIDFYIQSLFLEGMELDEAKVYLHEKMMEHTIV